jgi:hypothetical protein
MAQERDPDSTAVTAQASGFQRIVALHEASVELYERWLEDLDMPALQTIDFDTADRGFELYRQLYFMHLTMYFSCIKMEPRGEDDPPPAPCPPPPPNSPVLRPSN